MSEIVIDIKDVQRVIGQSIPSPFLDQIEVRSNSIIVTIKDKDESSVYLTSGAKIIKIFAIELFRWFCKLPNLESVYLNVYSNEKRLGKDYFFFCFINRKEIESYYGECSKFVDNASMSDPTINDTWRKEMMPNNDNKAKMYEFMKKFVKCNIKTKEKRNEQSIN